MAENLVWLATDRFPARKIIVWAHNYHIFRNVREVEVLANSDVYRGVTTMGDVVASAFGNDAYVLGFTAYGGEWGYWYPAYEPTPLPQPPAGSIESLLHESGIARGIIDFRSLPDDGAWLLNERIARPLNYVNARARWPRVMDGLFFTDRMTRSTASGWVITDDPAGRPAGMAAHPISPSGW